MDINIHPVPHTVFGKQTWSGIAPGRSNIEKDSGRMNGNYL